MSTINTSYAAMQYTMNATQQSNKQTKQQGSSKVAQNSQTETAGQKTLSKDAQAVLEKLKSKYGNMDFFVADPDSEDEAKEIMSRGTKEYSVMISSDELEKMAADEDYYNKNINTIDDAVKKSKEINEKFGAESDYGKENGVGISQIGIKVNADGTTSYFVELEKLSDKQKERIENAKEKRAEEKKQAAAKAEKTAQKNKTAKEEQAKKKTYVQANSLEDLEKKIKEIDWDSVKETKQETEGSRFDYSV